jgi:hypothetical protein
VDWLSIKDGSALEENNTARFRTSKVIGASDS